MAPHSRPQGQMPNLCWTHLQCVLSPSLKKVVLVLVRAARWKEMPQLEWSHQGGTRRQKGGTQRHLEMGSLETRSGNGSSSPGSRSRHRRQGPGGVLVHTSSEPRSITRFVETEEQMRSVAHPGNVRRRHQEERGGHWSSDCERSNPESHRDGNGARHRSQRPTKPSTRIPWYTRTASRDHSPKDAG